MLQGLESALGETAPVERQENDPVWSRCQEVGIASKDMHRELKSPDNEHTTFAKCHHE